MYKVMLSSRAFKSLKKLEFNIRYRILEKLMILREEAIPREAVKLKGEKDTYRLRIGDYRVLYKVLWKDRVILIFKIEHRRTSYKKL